MKRDGRAVLDAIRTKIAKLPQPTLGLKGSVSREAVLQIIERYIAAADK